MAQQPREVHRAACNAEAARLARDNSGGPLELLTLRKPALLLPVHSIMQAVGFDGDGNELVTAFGLHRVGELDQACF